MRKVRFVLGVYLVAAQAVTGQYFQFTQYNFSTQRVNPAWVGLTRNAIADFSYRNQKTGGDFQLNTNFFSAAYPFVRASTGNPFGGLGISLMSDKSGALFKSQEAAATMAINVATGKYQNLSIGFKGLFRWQRINTDGLFTGSQYLEGHGFNPALDNGEVPQPFQNHFFTLSSGLLWQETNRKGVLQKQFGFSFFDFNKPNPTFLDGSQDELPTTIVGHGTWRVYQDKQLGILPEFIVTHSSTKNMLVGGGRFEYLLGKTKDQVDLLVKYALGRSGILGLQLHRVNYSLGLSYDFPVGNNAANLGAFELGFEYRTPVDPRSRRELARKRNMKKKKPALARKPTNQPVKKTTPKSSVGQPSVVNTDKPSVITAKLDSLVDDTDSPVEIEKLDSLARNNPIPDPEVEVGKINHDPLLVEKITLHFRFQYNSTDLDDETEAFLRELSQTLATNPSLSVQVIGHTDNIGAAHLNQKLSVKRAEAVKAFLIKSGVSQDRVLAAGKGMDEPLNGNTTEAERAHNRRVEIKLFKP